MCDNLLCLPDGLEYTGSLPLPGNESVTWFEVTSDIRYPSPIQIAFSIALAAEWTREHASLSLIAIGLVLLKMMFMFQFTFKKIKN